MPLYAYEALSKDGKKVSDTIDASTEMDAKIQLGRRGLYPTRINLATSGQQEGFFTRIFAKKVSTKDKILLTNQLAVLLKSGVPLLEAVELLTEQFEGRMKTILSQVKDDLKGGVSLADALRKYPNIFENIYIQLVKVGEATGQLETILERLTSYMERQEEVSKKIRGALQMPIMQLVVALLVVVVLLAYVVPNMASVFQDSGRALPGPTQFLMNLSSIITGHYIILGGSLAALIFGFRYWVRTSSGARKWDEIKLRLPLIKYITKTNAVVQFSYTLGMLIEGGVNLAQALDITTQIIDNRILADTLSQARDKIIKQGKIAQYLEQTNIFPPIAIYLIKTGEGTGQLDTMLLRVAKNYEVELGELADNLTARLGPIMLVVMAVIVGFVVMSVALPMVQMSNVGGF